MYLQAYLKFEQTSGDPARVQILYERAIAEFPVSADLWLNYTEYLDRTLKVPHHPRLVFLVCYLVIVQLPMNGVCLYAGSKNSERCLL